MSENGGATELAGWRMQPDQGWHGLVGSRRPVAVMRPPTYLERAAAAEFEAARTEPDPEVAGRHFQRGLELQRVAGSVRPQEPLPYGGPVAHYGRMDAARVGITVILVLGVIAVVLWTLAGKTGGTAAQFAAPISGLTGICLGWLFTRDDGRSVLLADATARAGRPRAQSGRQADEAASGTEPISGADGPPAAQDRAGTDA